MNNDNQEPKKNNVNIASTPTTLFKLPITFVETNKLHKLDEHILTDLELTECNSGNNGNSSDLFIKKTHYISFLHFMLFDILNNRCVSNITCVIFNNIIV